MLLLQDAYPNPRWLAINKTFLFLGETLPEEKKKTQKKN